MRNIALSVVLVAVLTAFGCGSRETSGKAEVQHDDTQSAATGEEVTKAAERISATKATGKEQPLRPTSEGQEKEAAVAKLLTNSIGMKLMLIQPGDFLMGSPDSDELADPDEKPQHRVRITKAFYLGIYPVTQAEYRRVTGTNPSAFEGEPNLPVEWVTWEDAQEFCRMLSALPQEQTARHVYRLPTEAEWEYACRAGSTTRYCFGDDKASLGQHAWFGGNSKEKAHVVGERRSNAWGLHDMHGNVREWCSDWYADDYYRNSPPADPTGPATGPIHVVRGGGQGSSERECRSAKRHRLPFGNLSLDVGFRVCLIPADK